MASPPRGAAPSIQAPAIGETASGQPIGPGREIGKTGLRQTNGWVNEEFLTELNGRLGMQVYRRMADNDATVGAVLAAFELLLVGVKWTTEPKDSSDAAKEVADFCDGLRDDMSHTWADTVSEALTMMVYGWSLLEIVYKRRAGPDNDESWLRSTHDDGRIGWRKLAPRSQDTLWRWVMEEDGGIAGMEQMAPDATGTFIIPMAKALLFRTTSRKNNPEGRSILRNAYRAWYKLTNIEDIESIGIERELAGVPVVKVPNSLLNDRSEAGQAALQSYIKIARDLKFNEQGGIVLPSDTFPDKDGNPSAIPKVSVQLMTSGGSRTIDTRKVAEGYKSDIARSMLADFLMLGTQGKTGSYALSADKTDLFLQAGQRLLNEIAAVFNRHAIPRVLALNGMDVTLAPRYVPGSIAPEDLAKLADYVSKLSGAGMPMFPDERLENHLRAVAGLPEAPEQGLGLDVPPMVNTPDPGSNYFEPSPSPANDPRGVPFVAEVPAGRGDPRVALAKAGPAPLYVSRSVINARGVLAWARKAGLPVTEEAADLHVTLAYSREPVDWFKVGTSWQDRLELPPGGPRQLELFGRALVLRFASTELQWRWEEMRELGCSWDHDGYSPHITLGNLPEGADLEAMQERIASLPAYQGPIILGPEVFAALDLDRAKAGK